ncbi:hypothetical protein KCU98_g648, partial [Aureobasidium melanogenum]
MGPWKLRCASLASLHLWLTCANSAVLARTDIRSWLSASSNHWSPNTTIGYPGSADFLNSTERWTLFSAPTYSAVITPGTEADVAKVVNLANAHHVPFLATAGRHGYTTTLGQLDDGLAIDLSAFNSVNVNANAATVTLGGGTKASQVFDPLYNAGFQIQSGSCSCPGYVGVSLGGGVGRYQGVFGLLIDALLSVRMVTAKGQIITVSAGSNPDLFWGIRGAGFNFGIVLSATYKIQPLINKGQITNVDFIFPRNLSSAYFDALQTYNGSMPSKLATVSLINYNESTSSTQVVANWVYLGAVADARKALAPIFALNPPTADVSYVPWNKLLATSGWGEFDAEVCQKNVSRNLYSTVIRNISASTYKTAFTKMETFFNTNPNARYSSVEFEIFPNQAMLAVPDGQTAYPWRDALGYVSQSYAGWAVDDTTTQAAAASMARQLRTDFAATSGYPNLTIYVSYAHGDESLESKYGKSKLPRLAALKKIWDPSNVFGFNNALPTSYPG